MELKFEDKFVAFVDVLGFRNMVLGNHKHLNTYFNFIVNTFSKDAETKGLEYLLISDAILIYTTPNLEQLNRLIGSLAYIQAKLLSLGILIRGGISRGNLFVDKKNNIIVGDGLVKAYELELKAKYPRIILDRNLHKGFFSGFNSLIKELKSYENKPLLNNINLSNDLDIYTYINYGIIFNLFTKPNQFKIFIDKFKDHYYSNSFVEKYEWLKLHIESCLKLDLKYYESLPVLSGDARQVYNKRKKQLKFMTDL